MQRYILIGGIGSGKSTASALFAEQGAFCIDMDVLGHEILRESDVIAELSGVFGRSILSSQGHIDRRVLARLAFASEQATLQLNSVCHPRIVALLEKRLQRAEEEGNTLAVVEMSAYAGPQTSLERVVKEADGVIAVVASEEMRLNRAIASGYAAEDVRARIARQPSDAERRQWATFVIENDAGPDKLRAQVIELYRKLTQEGEPA